MSADPSPEEAREAVKRAAEASIELLDVLPEAAADYAELNPPGLPPESEARDVGWEWVERIAERWRRARGRPVVERWQAELPGG